LRNGSTASFASFAEWSVWAAGRADPPGYGQDHGHARADLPDAFIEQMTTASDAERRRVPAAQISVLGSGAGVSFRAPN